MYFLRDRKGEKFPLMTDCELLCMFYFDNGKPLFALKFYDEVLDNAVGSVRLNFTKEGPARVERIVQAYAEMTKDTAHCNAQTRALLQQMSEKGSTKGISSVEWSEDMFDLIIMLSRYLFVIYIGS